MFKVKYTQTSHVDRYKARLIAKGFSQIQKIDFEKIFSLTLRLESLRMLFVFAAHFGYKIEQISVPNIYLKGDLKEIIHIKIPKRYALPDNQQINQSKNRVLRLLRSLYKLKQLGRE